MGFCMSVFEVVGVNFVVLLFMGLYVMLSEELLLFLMNVVMFDSNGVGKLFGKFV